MAGEEANCHLRVNVRVEGSAVARHQYQGILFLLAKVLSSSHHALLVEQREVEGEGDVGKEEEEGGTGGGRRLESLGKVSRGGEKEEREDWVEEAHLLVWEEGENKDGGEDWKREESRNAWQAEKGRDEQRSKNGNKSVAEIPPPALNSIKASKVVHHIDLEEVERGESGGAIEEGVSHHSQEHSSQGGEK